jgi:hypothetical protein
MIRTILISILLTLSGCTILPNRVIVKNEVKTERDKYKRDVDAAIKIVEKNYAGYSDKRERFGVKTIEKAAKRARHATIKAKEPDDFYRIINDWLLVFQDKHLQLVVQDKQGKWLNYRFAQKVKAGVAQPYRSPELTAKILSDDTFLVTIPSFDLKYKAKIDSLMNQYDTEIKRRPNLIIDVRGNGGGSDPSYSSLIPYLYTQPYVMKGEEALATNEIANKWEAFIPKIPEQEEQLRSFCLEIVKKLRDAPNGTLVSMDEDKTVTLPEVFPLPSRIGIIINRGCGSTTEQFLLEARQSKKATLFGENSSGCLDYSNLVEFSLPSGKCNLMIPSTRSRRLPTEPIDNTGIAPDVRIDNLTGDTALNFILQHWNLE